MAEKSFERVVDSLVANEFSVEIDGAPVSGIFRVIGFKAYSLPVFDPSSSGAGMPKPEVKTVTVTKMVQRDPRTPFNQWLADCEKRGAAATRNVTIVAIDDGIETRRWTLKDCVVTDVSYSDFDSASMEMVEERITLAYTEVSHKFSTK